MLKFTKYNIYNPNMLLFKYQEMLSLLFLVIKPVSLCGVMDQKLFLHNLNRSIIAVRNVN